jgi:putative transposase
MAGSGYLWRRLTLKERKELLLWRKDHRRPWHSPPHFPNYTHLHFLISAACYRHAPLIGFSLERLDSFSASLLEVLQQQASRTVAWCVLPNHYHALVETPNVLRLIYELGRLHGRTSHAWNGEENMRGRKVFHRATERFMRSERHFFATLNYVHHNPVHHGYAECWTEWQWSSAPEYIEQMGRGEATRIWKEYPLRAYGQKWDAADS